MKVDLMIIGAQKCGTTTLYDILNLHPSLRGCRYKEPEFFSISPDWKANIDSYHSLFEQGNGVLYFEGSTTYTFYPLRNLNIWDDLFEYNRKLKFIYIVRNPIERIISSYMLYY